MATAVCPGSFDPVTNGHLDVFERAAALFEHVTVAVLINKTKSSVFTVEERMEMLSESLAPFPNVSVDAFHGLLVDYCRDKGISAIVKGLRAVSDFEFEFQLALMNRKLEPNLETLFLMPREEFTYISSRLVKEIGRLGGNIESFAPANVVAALRKKFN